MTARGRILAGTTLGFLLAILIASSAPASPSGGGPRLVHRSVSVQSTTDGDAIVESTEQFAFVVEIRNIGDSPATGVVGTLVPNGWTAQRATVAFPDMPVGGTATNAMPFEATATAFTCGEQYNARLDLATQQGSFSVPVTIPLTGVVAPASWMSTTPVVIPEQGEVETPLIVSGEGTGPIMDVNVRVLELRHPLDADLLISLRPPGWSTYIHLSVYEGLGADFINTLFDDEAELAMNQGAPPFTGTFRPDSGGTLAGVDAYRAEGTWNLRIRDAYPQNSGVLNSWGIELMTVRCNTAPIPSFITRPPEPRPGETITLQSTSTDAGRIVSQAWDLDNDGAFDDGTGVTAERSFPAVGTYKVGLRVVDDGENATSDVENVYVVQPRRAQRVCRVPRVVGRKLPAARTAIGRAGCRVGRVRHARSRRPRGRVVKQAPRAGSRRARGTRVNLTVSRG